MCHLLLGDSGDSLLRWLDIVITRTLLRNRELETGAPRSLSSILFRIFCFLFQRGPHANSAPVRGPQRAQVPQNLKSEAPKSGAPKSGAPKSGAPNGFFFHVSVFQRGAQTVRQCGAPKSPSPPKFKKRGLKNRSPKRFPPVSVFQRGAQTVRGPKEPKVPRKMSDLKI